MEVAGGVGPHARWRRARIVGRTHGERRVGPIRELDDQVRHGIRSEFGHRLRCRHWEGDTQGQTQWDCIL